MSKEKKTEALIPNQVKPLEENVPIEKDLPEIEYNKKNKKIKRKIATGLLCMFILETGIASLFMNMIKEDDLHNRIMRELQYKADGKISIDTGTYTGDLDFGIFEGFGEFIFDTGSIYKGEWKNNNIHGLGVLQVPTEGIYEGSFSDGVKSGQGVFSWDDGDTYDGEWKEDQMYGQGIYTTADKIIYTGTFEENEFKEGTCKFKNDTGTYLVTFKNREICDAKIHYSDGTKYSGQCSDEGITGDGKMVFANKSSYTGEFENDKRSGEGIYTWKTGATYDGDWLNDDMSGTGTYTYSKGNYATGTFEKNIFIEGTYHVKNDFGEYTFTIEDGEPTAVKMKLKNGTTYSGGMSKGKLHGKAQIKYSNGDKYSGNVSNNQKSGQGTYTWKSGATYEGEWSKDKMSGSGIYTYAKKEKGYMLTGKFKSGRPNGKCTYYVSSSEYYETNWSNGKCVKVYE